MTFKVKNILTIFAICISTVCVISLVKVIWFAKEPMIPTETQVMPKVVTVPQQPDMDSKDVVSQVTTLQQSPILDSAMSSTETPTEKQPALDSPALDSKDMAIRDKLLRAVENARKGNSSNLDEIIDNIGQYALKEFLPDFISFLEEDDAQVQLLGAVALYHLKDKESKDAVYQYVQGKDFKQLEKMVYAQDINERDYTQQMLASSIAIMTLGDIGDESVIPLLKSLKGIEDLKLEFGGGPVELALAKLGAVESLSDVRPDADHRSISRAAGAISKIRDPKKVPELMATVYNEECARQVRDTCIRTLGKINTEDVPDLMLSVINDSELPTTMRGTAVITASQTGNKIFIEPLLEIAESNSEFDIEAILGLAILEPDKHIKRVFEKIRDVNEPDIFRRSLAGRAQMYIPKKTLRDNKDELYACLNTTKTDGTPHDKVRVYMWTMIYNLFGEEPKVVLSSLKVADSIKGLVHRKVLLRHNFETASELREQTDEELNAIVQVYEPESLKEKEDG